MNFNELGFNDDVLRAIEDLGFDEPTEIQEQAIPLILEGRDMTAASATGSGKTLAFSAGLVNELDTDGLHGLVLAPTRELAQQVAREIERLSKYKDLHVAVVHGGVPYEPQIESMNKATVVVGTPGRTLDHLRKDNLDLSNIEIFILDEVDRMLDMGFIDDVTAIMEYCPEYRQNLFFSATLSTRVNRIAEKLGDDPVEVSVNNQVDPSKLTQVYYDIPDNIKFSLLHHLLKEEQSDLVMVFCNTRNTTDFVAKNLKAHGIDAYAIHGGFSQNQRNKRMNQFKEGDVTVLVCTDVAARGIDVDNVTHIYNYDIPSDPKQYVHRIGRTARAGEDGKAINILGGRDHDNFRRVMRHHSHHIDRVEPPRVERLDIKWTP